MFKKLLLIIICIGIHTTQAQYRDLIIFVDYSENFDEEKIKIDPNAGFGALTNELMIALEEQAAPLLITQSLWNNFIQRRDHFKTLDAKSQAQQIKASTSLAIAALITFHPRDWFMYAIDNYYFLIPRNYVKSVFLTNIPLLEDVITTAINDINNTQEKYDIKNLFKDSLMPRLMLDPGEIISGIRLNALTPMRNLLNPPTATEKAIVPLPLVLEKLFINKNDILYLNGATSQILQELILPEWNIYLVGHGTYPKSTFKPFFSDDKENIAPSSDKQLVAYEKGKIAGLKTEEFAQLLDFFNNQVSINLLFYNTCFAGSINTKIPYLTNDIKKIFNYMIISGATSSTITISGFIKIEDNKIDLRDALKFRKFFEGIELGLDLATTTNYVAQFYKDKKIINQFNIPLVRYPNTDKFIPVNLSFVKGPKSVHKVQEFTRTRANSISNEQAKKPGSYFDITTQEVLLLSTPYANFSIKITDEMPYFINLKDKSFIKEITIQNDTINLLEEIFEKMVRKYATKKDQKVLFINKLTIDNAQAKTKDIFATMGLTTTTNILLTPITLDKVAILDYEPDIITGKQDLRIYFNYNNTVYTATLPKKLTDIHALTKAEEQKYTDWYKTSIENLAKRTVTTDVSSLLDILKNRKSVEWLQTFSDY